MFYQLRYFKKSTNGLCGADFENKEEKDMVNIPLISSVSDLISFKLPFSNGFVGKYAVVTMNNGEKYYIGEESFLSLSFKINHL